jgi:hypothetical protein
MIRNRLSNNRKTFIELSGGLQISLSTFIIVLFTLVHDLLNWPVLQFARVVSPIKYRDTFWVLADADCFPTLGSGIYGLQVDTGCPAYIYGRPLLEVLNFLNFGQEDTLFFAMMMRFLFAVSLALIFRHLRIGLKSGLSLLTLILFSPGVQLMIYNSNFDLLIFAMVIFGYLAIQGQKVGLGLLVIFLSGLFKFYTIPLLLLFSILLPQKKSKIFSLFLFTLASFSAISDLRLMQEQIPSNGYAQFGLTIFTKYLEQIGISLSPLNSYLFSVGLFLICLIPMFLLNRKLPLKYESRDFTNNHFYLVTCFIFISCYLTGLSYDPRLIYLSLTGFLIVRSLEQGMIRKVFLSLLLVASFLSCGIELGFIPKGHTGLHPLRFIQLINDVAIHLLAAFLFLSILHWCVTLIRKCK